MSTDTKNFFLFWVDFPELLSCLCFTKRGLPFVFAPKKLSPQTTRNFALVCLWCGRTVGRAGGRCTVTWLPNFLGWVVYHIFLPMVLRCARRARELRYNLERSLTYNGYDIYSPLIYQTWLYIIPSCLKHLILLTRFSDIYDFLKRWFVCSFLRVQPTCVQGSPFDNGKVTVIYRVTAIYRSTLQKL